MTYTNYHTHTTFCDGKNTPEEMVQRAIELGFLELGFSTHSDLCKDLEGYCREIERLKSAYHDKISIKLGVEYDYYFDVDTSRFDYVIGGVHYLKKCGKLLPLDHSQEKFLPIIDDYYGGDIYSLCEDYFETLSGVYEKTGCDIVAHFDLVTKYNEGDRLFDTSNPRYIKAAEGALRTLMKKPVIFEINTGAIARGYRTAPYPAKPFLDIILSGGGKTILSADCHDKDFLAESFDKYRSFATLGRLPERAK